jgi:hypothetical protein
VCARARTDVHLCACVFRTRDHVCCTCACVGMRTQEAAEQRQHQQQAQPVGLSSPSAVPGRPTPLATQVALVKAVRAQSTRPKPDGAAACTADAPGPVADACPLEWTVLVLGPNNERFIFNQTAWALVEVRLGASPARPGGWLGGGARGGGGGRDECRFRVCVRGVPPPPGPPLGAPVLGGVDGPGRSCRPTVGGPTACARVVRQLRPPFPSPRPVVSLPVPACKWFPGGPPALRRPGIRHRQRVRPCAVARAAVGCPGRTRAVADGDHRCRRGRRRREGAGGACARTAPAAAGHDPVPV